MIIPILSIIATVSFRNTLRQKGHETPRLWLFPVLAGGSIYLAEWMVSFIIGMVAQTRDSAFLHMVPYLVGFFAILVWCPIISRAWMQVKALPPK